MTTYSESNKKAEDVLIVDDVLDNLNLLELILQNEGYHVRVAKTGNEALESIKYSPPDLVLLDILLPDINGFEVCRQIKKNELTRDIPVIFLSALDSIEEKIKGFSVGAIDYITKPFSTKEVTVRVGTHIDIRQMRIKIEENAKNLRLTNERLLVEISDRKAAEEAVETEREFLHVTLQAIGDGVIVTDVCGNVLLTNKIAEEITGWSKSEAKGKHINTIFNIINKISRKPCRNPVEAVLESGKIVELENNTILISRNCKEPVIADSCAPIFDKKNNILGVVLVFRDITEKQKLITNMQRTDKLESLGIFVGGIAHDFNNLLSGIFGYIELAHTNIPTDNVAYSYLKNALRLSNLAKNLTSRLIKFFKGDALIRKRGSLGNYVKECIPFTMAGTNIDCKYDIPQDLWSCDFDENQIGQVIGNIVLNAKQAMPNGGAIGVLLKNIILEEGEISELPKGRYIKTSISDTGTGIPNEIIKRIFDLFFTTKENGTGLGLATCYSIIKNHDGHICVESVLGKGSVFHIYLPASDKTICTEEEKTVTNHYGTGTVLIMDDEPYMLEILESKLNKMGYAVIQVKNGDEALSSFANSEKEGKKIDVAILDLTVTGGKGGSEIIDLLRKKYPHTPVFASSGYSEHSVISNPEEFGFTGSICKPFSSNELSKLLQQHVKKI